MMSSEFIIEVSEADFEQQVLIYSQQIPVVVDFWAEWCAPCRVLGPILENLTKEADGGFRLAKVNVDDNPNLSMRYTVRSIPVVKIFKEGHVVSEFVGAQPEPRVRELLREIIPSQSDLMEDKAWNLLRMSQTAEAEETFRQVIEKNPDSSSALLGLAKTLLLLGQGDEALIILKNFPASREFTTAESLVPLTEALNLTINDKNFYDVPVDAAFHNSIRLIQMGNIEAAMDGLLEVLRQDKNYRNGEAHQIMLGLLEVLGNYNPLTRQYRNELASILF